MQGVVSEIGKGRLLVGGNRGKVGRNFLVAWNAAFIFLPFFVFFIEDAVFVIAVS